LGKYANIMEADIPLYDENRPFERHFGLKTGLGTVFAIRKA
jgi:hypothetical protein